IEEKDLRVLKKLSDFNVLFLTCAAYAGTDFAAASAIKRYVELGGTLYASDLRCAMLETAFPEILDQELIKVRGKKSESVRAKVLDNGLARILGKTVDLHFDLGPWRPAAFKGSNVVTYLQGRFEAESGDIVVAPLMVKFAAKKGVVVFTSFH